MYRLAIVLIMAVMITNPASAQTAKAILCDVPDNRNAIGDRAYALQLWNKAMFLADKWVRLRDEKDYQDALVCYQESAAAYDWAGIWIQDEGASKEMFTSENMTISEKKKLISKYRQYKLSVARERKRQEQPSARLPAIRNNP